MAPHAMLLSIYRRANAPILAELLRPALAAGWRVRLWALDDVEPRLEEWTIGSGPGAKFDLLNGLLQEAAEGALVVADDDVAFGRTSVVAFADLAARAGFGISQPAHAFRSHRSHRVTLRRPLSRARLTTFVEIGPLFAVSAEWRARVAPFPDGIGMGWGLELSWMDLQDEGCRLGIVDAVPMRHLSPVGGAYVPQAESERLAGLLAERGVAGARELRWRELQRTLATWRPWQSAPPWDGLSGGGGCGPESPSGRS